MRHLLYIPLTGLGLYGGYRGSRWLRNRIKIFKQFVVPSILNQTSQNYTVWVSVRPEDRENPQIKELGRYLGRTFPDSVITYHGVCFWDDKYPDDIARERLVMALHNSMGELINHVGDVNNVLMTIQPSDDCYSRGVVESLQGLFANSDYQAIGYKHGYIMNYLTKELREYNPNTNPPFFTIKFPKETFIDPFKHVEYAKYKSHEYVGDNLKYLQLSERGFLVGTHGENISTHFNHPFAGEKVSEDIQDLFGIKNIPPLKIKYSLRKSIMRRLPHGWQRKLRYFFGERGFARLYSWLRS